MKFSAFTTILATAGSVSAAAIKGRDDKSDAQRDYDLQTEDLKQSGLCRFYKGDQPEYSKYQDLCEPKCGEARKLAIDDGKTFSVSCSASQATAVPWFQDPQGNGEFTLGQCLCNLPIVNFVGETFVASLPALGQVVCSVWKLATVDAAKLLAGTLSTGGAGTATQTLLKVAKMLAKQGKGASEYEEYVKKHLAAGDSCSFNIKQMFEDALKISDEDLANVGGA
ncbi:hypothetical protein BKA67DRAFT_249643 [Truncatella angustata]|uniref:Uncharacterized protein n=1 Tax=Truncatella angustata TaxID=152316 RepID=A0A9P8ZZ34_9PEZI|nr:uncharacterized protein BKA67DRAFT_249643 [Truncatella angustata]KAH6655792.1 hypothetical protein BKA67DRAFT_249643 [Truncatella angustata]